MWDTDIIGQIYMNGVTQSWTGLSPSSTQVLRIHPCCIYSKIFQWQSKLYDFYILFVGEVLVRCSRRNKQGFRVKEKITVRLGRNPEKKYLVQIVIFIAISKLARFTWLHLETGIFRFYFHNNIWPLCLINNPITVVLCCACHVSVSSPRL